MSTKRIEIKAFVDEEFVGLVIPAELIDASRPIDPNAALVIRLKSQAGFESFMIAMMEAGALVWPYIATQWNGGES